MASIDYRLTDARADPQGGADTLHSETLLRLPDCFLCYAPPSDAPEGAPLPSVGNGHITFGSFNNLTKLRPETIAVWAQILERVPGAQLMIKSKPLADEMTRRRYLELFAAEGIGPERVELASWIPSQSGHLGAYSRIDIALDTFPYNGTTTTCEALWMGVPVIALRGDRHAARVGHSLLAAVGMPEFAASSEQAYIEAAVGLAKDRGRLTALRGGLRERLRASPLCDSDAFARNVETAYRDMWRTWCHADPLPQVGEGRG
jgi:predicted O-linked N-acetylglucosamine transferase (SPINDLY family)